MGIMGQAVFSEGHGQAVIAEELQLRGQWWTQHLCHAPSHTARAFPALASTPAALSDSAWAFLLVPLGELWLQQPLTKGWEDAGSSSLLFYFFFPPFSQSRVPVPQHQLCLSWKGLSSKPSHKVSLTADKTPSHVALCCVNKHPASKQLGEMPHCWRLHVLLL